MEKRTCKSCACALNSKCYCVSVCPINGTPQAVVQKIWDDQKWGKA